MIPFKQITKILLRVHCQLILLKNIGIRAYWLEIKAMRLNSKEKYIELKSVLEEIMIGSNKQHINLPMFVTKFLPAEKNPYYLKTQAKYKRLYGTFEEALNSRLDLLKFYLNRPLKTKLELIDRLKVLTEFGNAEDIVSLTHKYSTDLINPVFLKQIFEFQALGYDLAGTRAKAMEIRKNYLFQDEDYIMLEKIHDKSIAIIGPLISMPYSIDLHNFDIIVCLNSTMHGFRSSGSKCDISYYSMRKAENAIRDLELLSHHVLCLSFFWKSQLDILKNRRISKSCFVRILHNPKNLVHNDNVPNMLQNIIYDLLWYSPSVIKIFGFNGYLTKTSYSEDYVINNRESDWAHFGMRIHEPFSNFSLVHNFLKTGLISVDTYGEVFRLDIRSYAQKLDLCIPYKTLDKWSPPSTNFIDHLDKT